jgi:YesN/AraC family two-component response regulator
MINLLLVDDDVIFLDGMKMLLKNQNFSITLAHNGDEAKQKMVNEKFDVVITDVLMEKVHGVEVILFVKEHCPATKVIAMTGGGWSPPEFHINSARLFGADGFLVKPFKIDTLTKEISKVLK